MKFKEYAIVPLRDVGGLPEECDERQADFWGLYGISNDDDAYAIGDFKSKHDAKFIKDALDAS